MVYNGKKLYVLKLDIQEKKITAKKRKKLVRLVRENVGRVLELVRKR